MLTLPNSFRSLIIVHMRHTPPFPITRIHYTNSPACRRKTQTENFFEFQNVSRICEAYTRKYALSNVFELAEQISKSPDPVSFYLTIISYILQLILLHNLTN